MRGEVIALDSDDCDDCSGARSRSARVSSICSASVAVIAVETGSMTLRVLKESSRARPAGVPLRRNR